METTHIVSCRLASGVETLDARVDVTLDSADAPTLIKMSRLHNDTCRETELDHAFAARALREKKLARNGTPVA